MRYRSDIDGLRAISILFVLSFHGGLSIFPSGFIGVDIFFVISGFLMTSIIYDSLRKDNFSFADFYQRRFWRLQPALIAVIVFTLAISATFYLPPDFIDFIKSAKYTTLFTSNQYFARSTTGYAAPDTAYLLLLHTWSLSIEWQWYLLLPAGLALFNRIMSSGQIKLASVVITVGMLILSLYLSYKFPDKSYYFFTSRIFEFMIGCSLVIFNFDNYRLNKITAFIIGLLSLIAIVYCATRKNLIPGYPDFHALIVSIACALLIVTGNVNNNLVSRVLSLPPLVFIGSISYSLYLWHWPIFATGRYLGLSGKPLFTVISFMLTFVLAYLCFIYIEKPCRKKRWTFINSFTILFLTPVLFFLTLSHLANKYNGLSLRFGSEYAHIESTLKKFDSPNREYCLNGNNDGKDKRCIIGNIDSNKRALLIGDSHSNHFWSFFDVLAKDARMSIMVQGTSSCLTLPGIYQFDWWYFKNRAYNECYNNTKTYYKNITKGNFDYVIIGEVWMNYAGDHIINNIGDERSVDLSRSRIERAMREAMDIIIKSGAKPVIIKTIYTMPDNYMSCFYQHIKIRTNYKTDTCNNHIEQAIDNDWFSQLFHKLKEDYPSLIIIDPKNVQCSSKNCQTDINGLPVYRDVGHLTDYASHYFGEEYLKKIGNPFK